MPAKIICVVSALLFAVVAFCAKPVLRRVLKRDATEQEIVILKAAMLLCCLAVALIMILPDYMN